ncbi:hypothetical protein A3H53_02125, partial [Candidatus Nomurabacteria bacterium RIFCSPLOWO2_02_FULL_40_10]
WNAPKNAADLGCEVFQMFTRSPQGGPAPKIDGEIIIKFKEEMKRWSQSECYIHAPYYINFASGSSKVREASIRIIREELERGSLIGAKSIMTHLGSSKDYSREEALKLVASGVSEIIKGYKGSTQFLLEISAGAGNVIGDTFEELEYILGDNDKIGICLDSAHMFSSGYDIKTKAGFKEVIDKIEDTIGINRVKLIHANDSMVDLGERKDRHEHIGDGKIGIGGFKNLFNMFPKVNFILETKPDKVTQDIKELKGLRAY